MGDVFHFRKVVRDFSLGVIFVCYNINYILNNLTSGAEEQKQQEAP